MVTFNQLFRKIRVKKKREVWLKALKGCPQKIATCLKVYIMKPRKPNSALRKVTKVRFLRTNKTAIVGIPGIGSELQQHALVLVRGGRVPDTPGIRYKLVKGKADFSFTESIVRGSRRSKFGVKRKVKVDDKENKVKLLKVKEEFYETDLKGFIQERELKYKDNIEVLIKERLSLYSLSLNLNEFNKKRLSFLVSNIFKMRYKMLNINFNLNLLSKKYKIKERF